jgi:hypothetical protein
MNARPMSLMPADKIAVDPKNMPAYTERISLLKSLKESSFAQMHAMEALRWNNLKYASLIWGAVFALSIKYTITERLKAVIISLVLGLVILLFRIYDQKLHNLGAASKTAFHNYCSLACKAINEPQSSLDFHGYYSPSKDSLIHEIFKIRSLIYILMIVLSIMLIWVTPLVH